MASNVNANASRLAKTNVLSHTTCMASLTGRDSLKRLKSFESVQLKDSFKFIQIHSVALPLFFIFIFIIIIKCIKTINSFQFFDMKLIHESIQLKISFDSFS